MGAAPIQNIGAYGVEVKSCFDQLEAVERDTGALVVFDKESCEFDYRNSVLKKVSFKIATLFLRLPFG